MDFNNFNGYITLINNDIPQNNFKYFEVNKANLKIEIPIENFKFENISDFFIETNCTFLECHKTNKGKNLKEENLLGFITNIKIELKEVLEYSLESSEINMFFNEDFLGDSILTLKPINSNYNPYFYLNFAYIFKENEEFLNISLIYTIYII